jgi:hypothetical protein
MRMGLQERRKLMERVGVDSERGRGMGEEKEQRDAVGRRGLVMKCV